MKKTRCDRETYVIQAASAGELDDMLRQHAAECAVCSEALRVSECLQIEFTHSTPQLPDASLLWWKAQIAAREKAAQQAAWPVRIARAIAGLVAIAAAVWICFDQPLLSRLTGTIFRGMRVSELFPGLSNPTVLGAAIVISGLFAVAARNIRAKILRF